MSVYRDSMPEKAEEPKYRLILHFHDRESGKLKHKTMIDAYSQGQALIHIWKECFKRDPKKEYLVVITDGCKQRPLFLIKNLRARGIQVAEPETYPNGDKGAFPS